MSVCPFCQRRLLSQASPTCNWCGEEIPDAAYQQRAAVEREAFFAHQALHDAESLTAIEGLNIGDPWVFPLDTLHVRPIVPRIAPPRNPPPIVEAPPLVEEPDPGAMTGDRFHHLEL